MGQTITTTQFYLKGRRQSTLTGYIRHVKGYSEPVQGSVFVKDVSEGSDNVDMSGKVVVITGANSGIGYELATYAAGKNAKVYMFCRSEKRGEAARQKITELTGSEKVELIQCDVSLKSSVEKAVNEFKTKENKLDALICNAGVLLNERTETSEGVETTFASHLIFGSYMLGLSLMPSIDPKEGRIIFVSSGGMYNTKFPSWETAASTGDVKSSSYSGNMAYSYAKRGQVLVAERWSKTYPQGPKVVSCHPGWVNTPAVEEAYGDQKKYLEPMRSTWQGAEGIAWLMTTGQNNLGENYGTWGQIDN